MISREWLSRARRRDQAIPKRKAICELFMGSGSAGSVGTGVGDIGHSLRFRGAQYVSRTITTDATSTYSFWVKRGTLGVISPIIENNIRFNADNTFTAFTLTTSAVFRDPTVWIHIHISNGGLYVDGISLGAVTTSAITNGRIGYDGTNYSDLYLARFCVVGGQALPHTSFGYLNTETNKWVTKTQAQVKAVVDAGGANSFMLDFDNGTSLTTLGYDKSSKGNNWTLNGHSLTLGSTYDWMLDVPGNSFATLNPLDISPTEGSGRAQILDGNLRLVGGNQFARGWKIPTAGQWYWEFRLLDAYAGPPDLWGIHGLSSGLAANLTGIYARNDGLGGVFQDGVKVQTFSTFSNPDVIGIAYDAVTRAVSVYRNGAQLGTSVTANATDKFIYAYQNGTADTSSVAYNFGQQPFAYTPPTGFKALCQANLPEPAIKNPKSNFDVVLATGAGIKSAAEALFPSNFFEWIKDRANSNNHQLIDIVRGTSAVLQSNTTAAETSYVAPSGSSVGWVWKAGGAAVTNNAGSIQSQVSANVEAGQSIVTATLSGTNATLGHGQGTAPELIIGKDRNGTIGWPVWHKDLTAGYTLVLNSTAAQASSPTTWNSTAPTSNVFSVGTAITGNWVFYCFRSIPGYSKIMSAVLNGAADGNYLDFGFKPAYILAKCISTTSNWFVWDDARSPDNPMNEILYPNLPNVEATSGFDVDATAFGAKIRTAQSGTWIFYAVADIAGKYA